MLGSFSSPLQEKSWLLGSRRNLPRVPSCPWAPMWVHRMLCHRRRWSEMLWGNRIAEELTFLQNQWYLLPIFAKLQPIKTVYFAFRLKPPCSLCTLETCRNLICKKTTSTPLSAITFLYQTPYQYPSCSISIKDQLQHPNPLSIRKTRSKSALLWLVPTASRL